MSIQSFGFPVMSLSEIIDMLNKQAAAHPHLLDKPVWVMNCPPLYFPVKEVVARHDGIGIYVERGGN